MPQLMVKGANTQFALHRFEGGLDLRQLYVALPQYRRILPHQIGAQQIVTILQLSRFQLGLVNSEVKAVPHYRFAFARDLDLEKTINTAGSFRAAPIRNNSWSRRGPLRCMARNLRNSRASFFRRMALSLARRPSLLART